MTGNPGVGVDGDVVIGVLDDVACSSVGYCVTVGQYGYGPPRSYYQAYSGLIETLAAGSWTSTPEPAPRSALPQFNYRPRSPMSVSCPLGGQCTVAGGFSVGTKTNDVEHVLIERETLRSTDVELLRGYAAPEWPCGLIDQAIELRHRIGGDLFYSRGCFRAEVRARARERSSAVHRPVGRLRQPAAQRPRHRAAPVLAVVAAAILRATSSV